jgi:hypothetical protein
MKITRPCIRPKKNPADYGDKFMQHTWKDGRCIHCRVKKKHAKVRACDCGCKGAILEDMQTTRIGTLTFIFGHETLDLFEEPRLIMT